MLGAGAHTRGSNLNCQQPMSARSGMQVTVTQLLPPQNIHKHTANRWHAAPLLLGMPMVELSPRSCPKWRFLE